MAIAVGTNIEDGFYTDELVQNYYETSSTTTGSRLSSYSTDASNVIVEVQEGQSKKTGSKIQPYDPEGLLSVFSGGLGL